MVIPLSHHGQLISMQDGPTQGPGLQLFSKVFTQPPPLLHLAPEHPPPLLHLAPEHPPPETQ